jgi:hypothetical protein
MATLRTTHLQHELAGEANITMLPDGTTVIPGLVTDSDDPQVVTTLDERIDGRLAGTNLATLADVATTPAPTVGDTLVFDGTRWVPGTPVARLG